MSIHVALRHVTEYAYDRAVILSPQQIRLRPAPHCRTRLLSYSQRVTPANHYVNWQQDPQGNYVARLTFPDKVHHFRVEVDLVAEMAVYNPFDFFLEPSAEQFPFAYEEVQLRELEPFLKLEPLTPLVRDYLATVDRTPRRTIDVLVGLNQLLQTDIRYLVRLEPGVQTPDETLEQRSGSCRDTTWLMVQLCRRLGLAARFVSGYLIQLVADVKPVTGPAGPPQDFTDLHAWCEVYLPGAGWVGFDPTSGLLAGEGHLPLACTPDPVSAAPITGAVEKCESTFHHEMSVQRIVESPRVTKPYSPEQWSSIVALGHAVDEDLVRHDVRLTMGGEPTFVSASDRDGRRVEDRGARADQEGARLRPAAPPETALRPQRLHPCGAGQVVSGRAAAAMGARLLLADRRRSLVVRRVAGGRRGTPGGTHARRRRTLHPCPDRRTGHHRRARPVRT